MPAIRNRVVVVDVMPGGGPVGCAGPAHDLVWFIRADAAPSEIAPALNALFALRSKQIADVRWVKGAA